MGILHGGKSASIVAGCVNTPHIEINKTTSFDEEIRLDCKNKLMHVLKVHRGKKGLGGLYNWDALATDLFNPKGRIETSCELVEFG